VVVRSQADVRFLLCADILLMERELACLNDSGNDTGGGLLS